MRTITAFTMCVILVISVTVCLPIANAGVKTGRVEKLAEARCANFMSAAVPQKPSDDLHIEARKGEAVKLRSNQLRKKNKAVAKAMKDLEERGLRPAFDKGVSILAVSKSGRIAKVAAQQETSIVEGDYELTFIPYDNGNNNTWEGTIYYRRPEGESVYGALLDVSSPSTVVVLREQIYSTHDGGTQLRRVGKNIRGGASRIEPVAYSYNNTVQFGTRLKEFIDCAIEGCAPILASCAQWGLLWPACFIPRCTPVIMSCAAAHL